MASIHTQVSQTLFANKVCETFICETFCVYTWKVSQIKFHKLYSRIKFAKRFAYTHENKVGELVSRIYLKNLNILF